MGGQRMDSKAVNRRVTERDELLPGISIIIPTFNSAKTLGLCLESIKGQDYPNDRVEVILADGGSTDETFDIINDFIAAGPFNVHVVFNKLKTGEAGKAVGLKYAKGPILAFIDSDNVLPSSDWLRKMVEPFKEPEIIASEPLEFSYRRSDSYITRYCALLGMNDPLCLFLGNYDRFSTLTGRWTDMPHKAEDRLNYLKIKLDKKNLPTIGANGFLIRRSALERCNVADYLFDIDVIYELIEQNYTFRVAKVKTGIIHIFSGDLKTLARKQRRRVRDYLYYKKLGVRKYPWKNVRKASLIKFAVFCITVLPLFIQSIKGYMKRPDKAWFIHPLACWLTFWEYGLGSLSGLLEVKELKREGWSQ